MQKLLIIQTAFLGDVVLATALIEKLKAYFPNSEIDFLLRKGNESILEAHPHLRKRWVWNKQTDKYKNLRVLLASIRQEKYDCVVNVQRFAASGFLTAFSNATHTVGFTKNPFSFLFSKRIVHHIGNGTHETERNQALIAHLTDHTPALPRLYPQEKHEKTAATYKIGDYRCIFPASVWHTKQFPAHRWASLIDILPPNETIYLLGSPADSALCENIMAQTRQKNVRNLCGKIDLLSIAALMRDARMNYANDSAPLHFATAMNAPVRAVFCSTVPEFGYTPLSADAQIIQVREKLPCRPCGLHGRKKCPLTHFDCAEKIDIQDFISEQNV